ncbi:MAG: 3'-5' exonuclease, partial [Deltaproteobacteria bacterium]|nr:3'-5' exonuclease [Deltaproteobacteria bacterium]
ANLEQLLDITRSLELEDERSLAEVIEHFEELKKQKRSIGLATGVDRSQDACQIMTVHASKGLEFPIVILPDLIRSLPNNSNRFLFDKEKGIAFSFKDAPFGKNNPSELMEELKAKEKEKDLEERKRLLYVALTRAEEQIIIPWHEEAKRVGPWIGWLKENIQSTLRDCASVPPVARLRRPTTLIGGSKSSSSAAEERTSFGGLPKASGERNGGDAEAIGKSTSEYFLLHPYDNPQIRTATPYYTVTELEHFEQKAPKEYPQTAKSHLKGAVFGNLIHNVLKELRNNSKLSLPKLIAIKLFEMNCAFSKEEIDETSALLEKFLKSDLAPPTWEGFHEFPFRLKIDEAVITGVIDYIYPTDEGWVICDFKTDTKADPKKYQLQMDTYALALAKGQNERPVTATKLLFLKSLLSHEEPCTTGRFETTEARLKELIDAKSATEHQEK